MKNRKLRKILLTICSAMLLVCLSVGATVAYLTSTTDTVKNTFTAGKVEIALDEAKVDSNGTALTGEAAERVQANEYKLLPGHTYDKDPTVTVKAGSEPSYIKLNVVVTKSKELDAIFGDDGAELITIFTGYDSNNWIYKGNTKDTTANTRTYEFWYKETVDARENAVTLDALFDQIKMPGEITNKQLATIAGMTITVTAHAIQADGFKDAEAAWKAYSTPVQNVEEGE